MRYTKNYKLKQPEADDYVLVEDFNENSNTVDELIKKIESVIEDLKNSEEKESLIKLIEKLEKDKANMSHSHTDREIWVDKNGQWESLRDSLTNKADLGKDGKVVPEQLPVPTKGLELGETEDKAYRGDRGKKAYEHSLKPHAPEDAYSKENMDNIIAGIKTSALKLGETEDKAYRGDRGMIAFNHAKSKHADPNAITKEEAIELFNSIAIDTILALS